MLLALGLGAASVVLAAEAPLPAIGPEVAVPPLPPEAEAAHQDLRVEEGARRVTTGMLDEAIFTEISPLTIPEIGVALPADQDH